MAFLIPFLLAGVIGIPLIVLLHSLWIMFFSKYSRTVPSGRHFKKKGRVAYAAYLLLYVVALQAGLVLIFWIFAGIAREADAAILFGFIAQFFVAKLLLSTIPKELFQKYTVEDSTSTP